MVQPLSLELRKLTGRFEEAQVMVEYGLIISLITMVGFIGVMALGGGVDSLYQVVKTVNDYLGLYTS
jgi:Flp pilus assembly pilin Flp